MRHRAQRGRLVFFRIIQGFGGGALQPTAQAILFEAYPPEGRAKAMAIFGLGAMVGPAIGPTLGGYIVDNFSWPLIFLINLPIGIVAFLMTLTYVRDPSYIQRASGRIDWVGLGLMTAGVSSLQYVLERGQHDDWFSSGTIVLLSVVAVVGIVWFIARQLRETKPLVDLSVFRFRSFAAGNIDRRHHRFRLVRPKLGHPVVSARRSGVFRVGYGAGVAAGRDRDRTEHGDHGTHLREVRSRAR